MKRGDRWFLAAEPSVECYDFSTDNKHRQYFALCLIALLVYVIGIPVLFATLLYRKRKVRHNTAHPAAHHSAQPCCLVGGGASKCCG